MRHCTLCDLNVYNFAELTREEIRALLTSEGRVCGRLYRRADGTLLTRDCPSTHADFVMHIQGMMGEVITVGAVAERPDTGISVTFTKEFINKLPL